MPPTYCCRTLDARVNDPYPPPPTSRGETVFNWNHELPADKNMTTLNYDEL